MPYVENWQIAYSPNNPLLDELMRHIVSDLKLDGYIPAADAKALEGVMETKKIFAGIEFQHAAVTFIYKLKPILKYHKAFIFIVIFIGDDIVTKRSRIFITISK